MYGAVCMQRAPAVHWLSGGLTGALAPQLIPGSDQYRCNYWGYSTVGFFAPMARYSAAAGAGGGGADVVAEFKTLVRECHRRGIEVRRAYPDPSLRPGLRHRGCWEAAQTCVTAAAAKQGGARSRLFGRAVWCRKWEALPVQHGSVL